MPTYAQLQAESWWGREIVTDELKQFEGWIRAHFGLPADAIGDKGNNVHLSGSHRSQEWILDSQHCTNRTYTVQSNLTAEQKRHIAGVDVTPTRQQLLEMCQRLDEATRAGRLEEVVYWYGNKDGDQRVDGYDNIRNAVATSDSSHLWHLHLSLDRRVLRDLNALRRVYAVLTGEGDDMTPEQDAALGRIDTRLAAIFYGMDANTFIDPPMQGEPNQLKGQIAEVARQVEAMAAPAAPVLSDEQLEVLADKVVAKLNTLRFVADGTG